MFLLLLATISAASGTTSRQQQQDCPLWTSPVNGSCVCDDELHGLVQCEEGIGAVALVTCFCMTTRDNSTVPVVGSCLFTCMLKIQSYYRIETNSSKDLNNVMCRPYKRTGVLCGKCIEGHGLPVYSFSLSCVECSDYKYNWLKYIAVAYGPLTLFYCIVILARGSATVGLMMGYVTVCQMMTIRKFATWLTVLNHEPRSFLAQKYVMTMLSIWNLDFFRSLYPPFCLHPQLSALHVLLLDYLVALYPLVLIFLTYLFVKLHYRFGLVVWLCRPLYHCLHWIRKEWDIKISLIEALATFYLLSYVKVINITADILTPVQLTRNFKHSKTFFFYDASIRYLHGEHFTWAVFALVFSLLFNIVPLIFFCLYPCRCFQRCLNKTGCRCHALHVFMDALLGSYSHAPRERRYFGALYLILRIIHVALSASLTPFTYLPTTSYVLMVTIISVAMCRPYRNKLHNTIDIILFSAVAHTFLMIVFYREGILVDPSEKYSNFCIHSMMVSIAVLSLYGVALLIRHITPRKFIKQKMAILFSKFNKVQMEESLPYRLKYYDCDCERDPLLHNSTSN